MTVLPEKADLDPNLNSVATFPYQAPQELEALADFKSRNPELFKKNDRLLYTHLASVISLLTLTTLSAITSPFLFYKLLFSCASAFFWFCLINVSIHHHLTHRNAAASDLAKKIMDGLYFVAVPSGSKRRTRYTRAHMNHHLRPFHETDVDHHYGTRRYLKMMSSGWTRMLYFLELTFVGAHVPGWEDDAFMNTVPLENWNAQTYEKVKEVERRKAVKMAFLEWCGVLTSLFLANFLGPVGSLIRVAIWGWALPMLLIKNWAHFLGQFQHYKQEFLAPQISINQKTKSFCVPGWLNYLTGGEISGHFLHHLYPEMPYYYVETARQRFAADSRMTQLFITY